MTTDTLDPEAIQHARASARLTGMARSIMAAAEVEPGFASEAAHTGRVRSAEDVLGVRATYAYGIARHGMGEAGARVRMVPEPDSAMTGRARSVGVAGQILRAEPFLWLHEPLSAALEHDYPDHVVAPDVCPYSSAWFQFESHVVVGADADGTRDLDAILLIDLQPSILATMTDPSAGHPDIPWTPELDRYPDGALMVLGMVAVGPTDDTGPVILEVVRRVVRYRAEWPKDPIVAVALRLLSFLASPYIPRTVEGLAPKLARSLERHGGVPRDRARQTITTIDLRAEARPLGEHHEPGDGTGGKKRRHVVRRHHRRQWYARDAVHRVIWVPQHMRGSGPLMEHRVSRVVR